MPTFWPKKVVFGENSKHISKHEPAQDEIYYSPEFRNGDFVLFGTGT